VGRRRCHRSSGSIETLSPSEAAASPILDNQQLYPEQLALQSVAATKYRNGILNTYTSHEDRIEIAPLPGDRNDQPFFILSESGPQYVVAVEPYGDAQGLKELWTIDGQSGAFERYVPADSLFGPQRAADLVRQSAPQTDWDRFSPAEPILTVIDDRGTGKYASSPRTTAGLRMSHLSTHGPVMLIHSNRQTQSLSSSQVRLRLRHPLRRSRVKRLQRRRQSSSNGLLRTAL